MATRYWIKPGALLLAALFPHQKAMSDPLENAVQAGISEIMTSSILLTNSETVRFGLWNFNPNDYFKIDNDQLGSAESAQLRQEITMISLPYQWQTTLPGSDDELLVLAKVAYLDVDQDIQIITSDDPGTDELRDTIITGTLGGAWRHHLDDNWRVTLGLYSHLLHYKNYTAYKTQASVPLAPVLDGVLTNISVNALIAEPTLTVNYLLDAQGAQWNFFSDYHYMTGTTYGADIEAHKAKPEASFWSNGLRMKVPTKAQHLPAQDLWLRMARVDVAGDMEPALGGTYYYEAGIAWLVETNNYMGLLDNIGIGINFNYGSALRGGSLVFMFNEE
ncbi:Solitary outer membrane autotransporter beta-barrel domain [Marinobacter sp. 1Y8]